MGFALVRELLQVFNGVLFLNYRFVAGVLVQEEVDYFRIRNEVVTHIGNELLFWIRFDDVR